VLLETSYRAARLVRPDRSEVANAVGAAFAQVGGEVDRIFSLVGRSRGAVLEEAHEQARQRAIAAGAEPTSVRIVDTEDVPLSHLPEGTAPRVGMKAIGQTTTKETSTEGPAR
jgi:hypothetical protein